MEATTTTETIEDQIAALEVRLEALDAAVPMRMLVDKHIDDARSHFGKVQYANEWTIRYATQAAEQMAEGANVSMLLSEAARHAQEAADSHEQAVAEFHTARKLIHAIEASV